ncbi:MAG: TAT-variant-translocated molybdopterin oxidoreductase [Saprospiraceae bacterium]|nr:TAT-variant-translocated molybdopterin oxidoreductase [Saprospiraceae bacterium]
MKTKQNGTWVGAKDLSRDPEFMEHAHKEFNEHLPIVDSFGDNRSLEVGASRRDFLKYLGFGLGAATVAASCEIPLKRAIPYVVKPDTIVPGVANYYASTIAQGGDYCSVLVKTREGRPIKIEGNDLSGVTKGGTSARAQAYVLSLYDTNRFRSPQKRANGTWEAATWDEIDNAVAGLNTNAQVRIVANTILSPTAKKVINEFTGKYPNTRVVTYDPVSSAGLLRANDQCFGLKVVPDYHFDKAKTVVGIQADFLGTWISPIEYAKGYIENRKIKDAHHPEMSRHFQIETYMSLTGSNADNRVQVSPSQIGAAIKHLYNAVASRTGGVAVSAAQLPDTTAQALDKVAEALVAHRGESLVVCGTNNVGEQVLVNAINNLLGNYGATITFAEHSNLRQGDESQMGALLSEMESGRVDALFVMGANPVFDLPNGEAFAAAISNVGLSISFALLDDETTAACQFVAPAHHGLEAWGDAEPKKGHLSLTQPTIAPLFDTRQAEESLLKWSGSAAYQSDADQPYYEYLRSVWERDVMPAAGATDFQAFWDKALHDGVLHVAQAPVQVAFAGDVRAAGANVSSVEANGLEVTLYESISMGGGQYANNPWLMEMPDPITRCVWGNYLSIPLTWDGVRAFDGLNDLEDGDIATLMVGGASVNVPVIKQFGQKQGTLALALGYGRTNAGRCGTGVGTNVQGWLSYDGDGLLQYFVSGADLSGKVGEEEYLACVQYHHTMGVKGTDAATGEEINADEAATVYNTYFGLVKQGPQGSLVDRSIIRRAHIDDVETFIHDLEHEREHHQYLNAQQIYEGYDDLYKEGHHWGMHVDLNACIGCAACTVACMAENNVPVVGKREVGRHHEMTWLRIDRYYYGDVENPNVVYQPLMCQHCDNAPCENVCPVNATNHSSEGLNQMAYNRCVGTRYCANNCPYKVRRFNWLDYTTADLWPVNERGIDHEAEVPWAADNLTRMVLNPDVTVRTRGVIEKCSFCVQRIQQGKLKAKSEGRRLEDHDVKTACQTACPTGAITFGDMNNKEGDLAKKLESPLNYIVLEEVNTRSSVNYQARISNKDESLVS